MAKAKTNKTDINKLTKNLFTSMEDFSELKELPGGRLYFGGKILTDDDKKSIIYEAGTILSSPLFKILLSDMKHVACKKMYNEGPDDLEMLKGGKWILYTLDVMERKLLKLSRLKN